MFRLLRDMMQGVLLALLYVRYVRNVSTYRQLRDELALWYRAHPTVMPEGLRGWYGHAVREMNDMANPPGPDETLDLLQKQLNSPRTTEDRDLIDTLVAALRLPWTGRRFIGSDPIKAIQKAILTPNEVGAVKELLQKAELCCGACGRPLRDGELITFMSPTSISPQLYCYRCIRPTWVACTKCDDVAMIDRKFYIGQHKGCATHDTTPTAYKAAVRTPEPSIWQHIAQQAELGNMTIDWGTAMPAAPAIDPDDLIDEEEEL